MLPTNPLLNATAPAGPHLPVALLRQYAAGTLAPAAQHRVEAHTLACSRCADILDGLLQTPPATTDQALAQLQQRLRLRVQEQAAPARQAREPRRHRWLAPQLATAAALLLGLVAGGWWAWQQRHPTARASQPVAAAISTPPRVAAATGAERQPAASAAKAALPDTTQVASSVPKPLASQRHVPATSQPLRAARGAHRPAAGGLVVATHPPTRLAADSAPATLAAPAVAAVAGRLAQPDSAGRLGPAASPSRHLARVAGPEVARVRATAMPAGPALPPAPVGGYPALRDKLRREGAEFVPEAPGQRLTGTVRLRLTIGPDGKIETIHVVHGLRADYDAEAQRLVCEGTAWAPGVSGGHRAAQTVEVTVPFEPGASGY